MSRVLVTGANGFVGRAVVTELVRRDVAVTAAVRRESVFTATVRVAHVGDLGTTTNWMPALADCDAVVHCAARVHVMRETGGNALDAFRVANVVGSVRLIRQAAGAGVRRLVFISSIKVNGECTRPGAPFTEQDVPAPSDPYGVSKWEAEQELQLIAVAHGLELVIIRPPLVYGPGVRANFLSMARWLRRGLPLPFGSVTSNRRTLVALDNLVDLIHLCINHPAAAGQTFLAGDGDDMSTADLLRRTAMALGVRPILIPVPERLLAAGASLLGRGALWQRIGGTLQASVNHARLTLGWQPPIPVDEGLRRAVADFSTRSEFV